MARLLSRTSRTWRFMSVIERISPDASSILDLGCGIGALTASLLERFPSSSLIGVDKSKYLLRKLQRKRMASTVLADIQNLPLKEDSFDAAIAIQVLHEIISLEGPHALVQALRNTWSSLKRGGELVIFDHVNPGDATILVQLSDEMLEKLREFQTKFKHRQITCQGQGKKLIGISLRDLYDFLTKIWALNSKLEEEEMNETHTPFTSRELQDFLTEAGFRVEHFSSLNPIHLPKGIIVKSKVDLPKRQIVLKARKRIRNGNSK